MISVILGLLTAMLVFAGDNCASSQDGKDGAAIKVGYDYHYFSVRGYEIDRPMILIADPQRSKFYNPMTNWIDSLNSTPEGRAEYQASRPKVIKSGDIGKYPTRWEKMYVEKFRADGLVRSYDTVGDDRYYYDEPLSRMEWEIVDSVKPILDYECMMARTDYHGRKWTVWFTPDIPVQDGPWKLEGLPGLILEAGDSVGQYHFTATGIEAYPDEVPPVYEQELYERIERKKLLELKRFVAENLGAIITAQTSVKGLRPSQFKSLQLKADLDFIETDYH